MSDAQDTNGKRGGLYAISENSNVRLGLAVLMLLGVAWLLNSFANLEKTVDDKYLSKELFEANSKLVDMQFAQLSKDIASLKDEVRELQDLLRKNGGTK